MQGLRKRIRDGERLLGTFAFLPSPSIVEIIGMTGFDFVIIDQEHSAKDPSTIENMIRAAQLQGLSPLVRVAENNEKMILQALEAGAEGVVIPFIEDAEEAVAAVQAARYTPIGRRGTCTLTRAASYGLRRSEFAKVVDEANAKVVVIGSIESQRGMRNIPEILKATSKLDALIIGRSDLAADLGVPGQTSHPEVLELVEQVTNVARTEHEVRFGIGLYGPKDAGGWVEKGYSVFFYSADTTILANAMADITHSWRSARDSYAIAEKER